MKEFINNNRELFVGYLIWVALNFIALCVSDGFGSRYFYPFQDDGLSIYVTNGYDGLTHAYDISEFLVYTIIPLICIYIYSLIKQPKIN